MTKDIWRGLLFRLRTTVPLLLAPALLAPLVVDADNAPKVSSDTPLREIVITAEKRKSTVQKTPISITALSGKEIQDLGLTSAQSIVQAAPGISVASAGPGQAQYEIRGLSSDGGEAATVGFYLDDIPITPPATATTGKSAIDPDLYDIDRVEVLRGPQGTLYGASSMGGTVKFVSNPPDLSGTYASTDTTGSVTSAAGANYRQNFMLNVPLISDFVALRAVATYSHDAGWISRIIVPNFPSPAEGGMSRGVVSDVPGSTVIHGVNYEDLGSARISLLIKPTDRLRITPAVFFQDIYQGGMNTYDSDPGTLAHYQPFNVPEPFRDRFTVLSLPVVADFDHFNFTSVTGYWTRRVEQLQDGTEQIVVNVPFPAYDVADGGPGPTQAFEIDKLHQLSQEFRVASTGDSRLEWLGGLYYSDYYDTFTTGSSPPGLAAQPQIYGTDVLFDVTEPLHVRQEAIFAHGSYNFTNALRLEAGARYFWYQSEFDSTAFGYLYNSTTPETSAAPASSRGVNPMVNLSYQITSNTMLYASAAKGFREGAGNFPIATTGPGGEACLASLEAIGRTSAPTLFNPDTVWDFEAGEKARLADQKVILNSDIYDIRWAHVQEPVALTCGLGFTTNGPDAEVRGGEAEIQALVVPGLLVSQSVGYTHGVFIQSFAAANIVEGEPLLDAPHWTASTIIRYAIPLDNRSLILQAQNSYTSSSYDLSYQLNRLPSRDTLGMRIGLETPKWDAYLFAENVLNHHQLLENINLLTYAGPYYNRVATNQPLTIGINAAVKF